MLDGSSRRCRWPAAIRAPSTWYSRNRIGAIDDPGETAELAELVHAGLSPYDALRTSTTNPFDFLGELDQSGTIEEGKRADLVLLRENPLSDISRTRQIDGVMVRGEWISADQIQDRLIELADQYAGDQQL